MRENMSSENLKTEALALFKKCEFENVLRLFKRCGAETPGTETTSDPDALFLEALSFLALGRNDEAKALFERLLTPFEERLRAIVADALSPVKDQSLVTDRTLFAAGVLFFLVGADAKALKSLLAIEDPLLREKASVTSDAILERLSGRPFFLDEREHPPERSIEEDESETRSQVKSEAELENAACASTELAKEMELARYTRFIRAWVSNGVDLSRFREGPSFDYEGRISVLFVESFLAISRHDWKQARSLAARIVSDGFKQEGGRLEALACYSSGEFGEAIRALESVEPGPEVKLDLALYMISRGDFDGASNTLAHFEKEHSPSPRFHELKAYLFAKRGLLSDAVIEYGQALALDPRSWRSALNGAKLLLAQLRFAETLAFIVKHSSALSHAPEKISVEAETIARTAKKLSGKPAKLSS
jgi:tetratricopeptide (TPR) repeat protein